MTLLRSVMLVLASSMLFAANPAAAAPAPPRSPLEAPEPVKTVILRVDGSETLDDLAEAGVDLSRGATRVPSGIEDWGKDRKRPTSELVPGHGTYPGPVDVVFETSGPPASTPRPTAAGRRWIRRATRRPSSVSPARRST